MEHRRPRLSKCLFLIRSVNGWPASECWFETDHVNFRFPSPSRRKQGYQVRDAVSSSVPAVIFSGRIPRPFPMMTASGAAAKLNNAPIFTES